jgi:Flp pilus assembly pilin Flp
MNEEKIMMLYFIHRALCRNQVGAAGVEYALLIGLASLAIILGTVGLSGNIQAAFQTVTDAFAN